MQHINVRVPKHWELVMFSDSHEGNRLQYSKGIRETIKYIMAKPNRLAIHLGDAIEGLYYDDKRFTPQTVIISPTEAKQNVIEQFKPLMEDQRLITLMMGNHEFTLCKKAGNLTADMCKSLNVPYGGFTCVCDFVGPGAKTQFKGFFDHGHRSIRTVADDPIRRLANEKLQLKQHLKNKMGDCLLMAKGHTHKLIVAEPIDMVFLTTEGDDIRERYTRSAYREHSYIHPDHRWYVNTGSYVKTFMMGVESYSEVAEYDPIEIGYAVATIDDGQLVNVRKVIL